MLAALPKGPNYYSPDRHPDRTKDRLAYVLSRMQEDGISGRTRSTSPRRGCRAWWPMAGSRRGRPATTSSTMSRGKRAPPPASRTSQPPEITLHTTIRPDIQKAAETALQEGLAQYEMRTGRVEWQRRGSQHRRGRPQDRSRRRTDGQVVAAGARSRARAALRRALDTAVILGSDKNGVKVGLKDGRMVPCSATGACAASTPTTSCS